MAFRLGKYAFVGAGAVVTKYIGAYECWVGNPAKKRGWMSEYGHALNFDENGLASCLESGQQYQKTEKGVVRIS